MIYFIIGIVFFNFLALYILKDLRNYLKYSSLIMVTSGYATIIFNYILKGFINSRISMINVSKITDIIYRKTINKGLVLILIGGMQLIIYIIIKYYEKYAHKIIITNYKRRIINK